MPLYAVTFNAVAVAAAQDVFELVTDASTRLAIHEIRLGQYTDFGDAAAEILGLSVVRGYTVSGSGGSAATPALFEPWSRVATTTAEVNNTTVANTGTAVTMLSDAWNIQAPYLWQPTKTPILIPVSTRVVVRLTAPADSITTNGTIVFEELNSGPYVA